MKIMVLEGSPNRHGSSNMLAEAFIRGARQAGELQQIIQQKKQLEKLEIHL